MDDPGRRDDEVAGPRADRGRTLGHREPDRRAGHARVRAAALIAAVCLRGPSPAQDGLLRADYANWDEWVAARLAPGDGASEAVAALAQVEAALASGLSDEVIRRRAHAACARLS